MKFWLIMAEDHYKYPKVTTMYLSDEGCKIQEPRFVESKCGSWKKTEVQGFHLDGGGSVSSKAHRNELPFFGGILGVYSSHVEFVIAHLESTPQRESGLYQFGGWPGPTFMTSAERTEALRLLNSIRKESKAIADIENDAFNKTFVGKPMPHIQAERRPVGKIEKA